jgi:hypothetical protein
MHDPRAVAVSLASSKAEPIDRATARMDDPDETLSGSTARSHQHMRQRLLRWSEHVESWLGAPFPVHLLRYEDMHADPHAAFAAAAAFLGLPHGPEQIAAAIDASSFPAGAQEARRTVESRAVSRLLREAHRRQRDSRSSRLRASWPRTGR